MSQTEGATVIRGCKLVVDCPKQWADLQLIHGTPAVRFCGDCQAAVHYATEETLREHTLQGHCVALAADGVVSMRMGNWVDVDSVPDSGVDYLDIQSFLRKSSS